MEKKGKFGSDWVEGFAKQALAAGLSPEKVKELLKVASTMESMKDPNFAEGVLKVAQETGLEKDAGFWKGLWGMAKHPLGSAALVGGGILGGGAIRNAWQQHFNRGDMDRRSMALMDAARRGIINYDDAVGHLRNQYIRQAQNRLGTMGANRDPYASYYGFG